MIYRYNNIISIKSLLAVRNFNFHHWYRTIIVESSNGLDLVHLNTLTVWFLSSYQQQYGSLIKNTPFHNEQTWNRCSVFQNPDGQGSKSRWKNAEFSKNFARFARNFGKDTKSLDEVWQTQKIQGERTFIPSLQWNPTGN